VAQGIGPEFKPQYCKKKKKRKEKKKEKEKTLYLLLPKGKTPLLCPTSPNLTCLVIK
jgi:hypothetical protein